MLGNSIHRYSMHFREHHSKRLGFEKYHFERCDCVVKYIIITISYYPLTPPFFQLDTHRFF